MRRRLLRLGALWVALGWGGLAAAQVFVVPRRPNKSQVRYFEFKWRHLDIQMGPEADTERAEAVGEALEGAAEQAPPGPAAVGADEAASGELTGAAGAAGSAAPAEGGWRPEGRDAPSEEGTFEGPLAAGAGEDALAGSGEGGAPTPRAGAEPGPAPQSEDPVEDEALAEDPGAPTDDRHRPAWSARGRLARGESRQGGVRLYFYEREREIAERAAGYIDQAYEYLVERFDYVPTETFPYILYSSYQEFLQTNLFPLQEGVLGVTSPKDLKLTLPYFGDHRLFDEVGTHEMVHQFTIQKVRTVAEEAKLWGDPLQAMPLWFIEGIAEFYAHRGVDPEAEMLVRDILLNPDFSLGYAMLDFFADRPGSVLWTYKVGQVRVAFLEETYGAGFIQRVLEAAPLLIGSYESEKQGKRGFVRLLKRLTGDSPPEISAKFEVWVKRRAFQSYVDASDDLVEGRALRSVEGRMNSMTASPSGELLLYRSMDLETGQSRLFLVDPRAPKAALKVVTDGRPGAESLHPVTSRNFDLGEDSLAYVAEAEGGDVLYWQAYTHKVEAVEAREGGTQARERVDGIDEQGRPWAVRLSLGRRVGYALAEQGVLAAESPAFSPDGRRLAFIGLDRDGQKDLYILEPRAKGDFTLRRLTEDVWAERGLDWGPDGVVFSSDATSHGRYNLFAIDPDLPAAPRRLTTAPYDHRSPTVLPDGRVLFTAFRAGRGDLYEVSGDEVRRLTQVSTGVYEPAPGPEGGVWLLLHKGAKRRPTLAPAESLKPRETLAIGPDGPVRTLPSRALPGAEAYAPFAAENWEMGSIFGFFGAGVGGIFGQLQASASDRLRNQGLLTSLFIFGSLDLTDGYLFYVNQEGRATWGAGLFQSILFREDTTIPALPYSLISTERFFGAQGTWRYPLDTFRHVQADLSLGAVQYFLTPERRLLLSSPHLNLTGRDLLPFWDAQNSGLRPQAEASLRFGYDTIRYHPGTGPLSGASFMLEVRAASQPLHGEIWGNARADGELYFPISGRANFFLRGSAGTVFGGRLARQFYLSSFDTLRGVPFGDTAFLLGNHYFFSTAELQIPMNSIIRVILFSDLEAVLAVDFGGVGEDLEGLWAKRVLDLVVGANLAMGPLVFRLHFAKPVDIGGDPRAVGVSRDLPNQGDWVTNFSLGWLYF